jgi:hypothetical protein
MPHRTVKLKIALSQTHSSKYQEFQNLRDGLIAVLIDWPIEKWDVARLHMPTGNAHAIPSTTLVSQQTREWLHAIANTEESLLPSSKEEATLERLEQILLLAKMNSI